MNSEFGITITDIVQFKITEEKLDTVKTSLENEVKAITARHTAKDEDIEKTGLSDKLERLKAQAKEIKDGLDSKTKEYQSRVDKRKKIAESLSEIRGAYDKPDTLFHIGYLLGNIPEESAMITKYEEVIAQALEIYKIKTEFKNKLEEIYAPIQDIIKDNGLLQDSQFGLNITTDLRMKGPGFKEEFIGYIHGRVRSSFKGAGADLLTDMIGKCDFSKEAEVQNFLKELVDKIRYNGAVAPDREKVSLDDLFKANKTLQDFYTFLFNLDYITPEYSLKLDGRDLRQLSPGERGALLLIFYLLLDKSDVPLIIDQPEENLDNESIYKLLVPAIKEARNKKQIIMVTHNPNLAVVCDSDQIICAEKDMTQIPIIKYALGAIENRTICGKIVDILEGTKPAFQKREVKYDLT